MPDPRDKVILQSPGQGNTDGIDGLFPAVNYEIESDGYQESWVDGQPKISIVYRVRWSKSALWACNMLGTHGTSSSRTSKVSRFIPAAFPDGDFEPEVYQQGFTECPFLGWWCTGIEFIDANEFTLQYQDTGFLQNSLKKADDLLPGFDYDYATGNMLDPGYDSYGKPANGTGGGFATYRATFEPLPYEIRTDAEMSTLPSPLNGCELSRYVIRTYRFAGKAFTIQGGGLYWRDILQSATTESARRAAMIPEGYPRIFPSANVQYQWLYVPGIPWTAIDNCLGKVNAAETGSGNYVKFDYRSEWQGQVVTNGTINGFDAGTLLFLGVSEIKPVVSATGQMLYHITYAFEYRPKNGTGGTGGHNQPFRVNPEGFQRVVRGGTAFPNNVYNSNTANWKDLYDEAQFTSLFKL